MDKSVLKEHSYYWLSRSDGADTCLVYCYKNPDVGNGDQLGFGFNIADGGGWAPLWDVPGDTIIREAFPQGEAVKDLASVIAEIDKAQDEVKALCHGKRWIMCVPARPDEDSDLVISGALRAAKNAILSFHPARTDRCAKCGYTVYGCHCNPAEACTALHKHEEAEKALREALKAINIEHKQDGTWLMIDSGGLHAAINIGYRELGRDGYDGIIGRAIDNWRLNRVVLLANDTEVKDA
jgi:hypothetical protein